MSIGSFSSTVFVASVTILSLGRPVAAATFTLQPTSATTTLGEANASNALAFSFDQSGLSSPYTSGVTDFNTYLAGSPTHTEVFNNNHYRSASGMTTGQVTYDLGATFTVTDLALWNFNRTGSSSAIQNFEIIASLDAAFTTPVNLGSFTATQPISNTPVVAERFSFAATDARFLRLDIMSNYGDTRTGIGEVVFNGEVVPEPSTVLGTGVSILLGGALTLYHARRRQQNRMANKVAED